MLAKVSVVLILFATSFSALAYSYDHPEENSCKELGEAIQWLKLCVQDARICVDTQLMAQNGYKASKRSVQNDLYKNLDAYIAKDCGPVPAALCNVKGTKNLCRGGF